MTTKQEIEEIEAVEGRLVRGFQCAECGEWIDDKPWFTCSICGKRVCEDCQRRHVPLCFAKIWGMVEEKEGELVSVEKPRVFTIK